MPSFIEVRSPLSAAAASSELKSFGISSDVIILQHKSIAFCLHPAGTFTPGFFMLPTSYVLREAPKIDQPEDVFLHTFNSDTVDGVQHMRQLYHLGFEKAIILQALHHRTGFHDVVFTEAHGMIATETSQPRPTKPWPARQPRISTKKMYSSQSASIRSDCCLDCGVLGCDLQTFFSSFIDTLCTSVDGLSLPEIVETSFQQFAHHDQFDRFVSYSFCSATSWPSVRSGLISP